MKKISANVSIPSHVASSWPVIHTDLPLGRPISLTSQKVKLAEKFRKMKIGFRCLHFVPDNEMRVR